MVILKKRWKSILVMCMMVVAMMTSMVWAEGEIESGSVSGSLVTYLGNGTETEQVLTQDKDGMTYLFLPATADLTQLRLAVADNKVFVGTVEGKTLSSSEINGNVVDLTGLFGTVTAGQTWPLQVYEADVLIQTIHIMKSENLPSIHIALEDTDLTYIHKKKSNTAKGQFLYRDGMNEMSVELAKFKGRGNSSWNKSGQKKPYNIKLDKKVELIAGAGEAKDWCLLSNNCYDKTGIYNYLAYNLYDAIDGASALKSQTVDLYVNHEYRGTYFLTEKVEIKETRVDIRETEFAVEDEKRKTLVTAGEISELQAVGFKDEISTTGKKLTWIKAPEDDPVLNAGVQAYQYATKSTVDVPGGFLIEMDATFYKEVSWFITRRGATIVVKEPEYASKEQLQQIAIYVQQFEDALYAESGVNDKGRTYTDYIDEDSFLKRFAVDTVMNNYDMMDKSCYFYIDVNEDGGFDGQKLYAGPAWDYDRCGPEENVFLIFKQFTEPSPLYDGRQEWARQMLQRGDFMANFSAFSDGALKTEWTKLAAELPGVIARLAPSQAMNETLWGNQFAETAESILKRFGTDRYQYWYETIFDRSQKLLGVEVTYDETSRILYANIEGAFTMVQWYTIANDGTKTDIPGANGASLDLPEEIRAGRFGVAVTGNNPGDGSYEDSRSVTMYSDIVEVGKKISFYADGKLLDCGEYLVEPGGSLAQDLWPVIPQKEGYTAQWSVTELEQVYEDMAVEAVYTPIQYHVLYYKNGADKGTMKKSTHTYDEASTLTANGFKRTGYWFNGWNTKKDGTGKRYRNQTEVFNLTAKQDGKIRLYAQWRVATYRIEYKGLRGVEVNNPETYTIEDQTILSNPVHEEYLFIGWTWKGQDTPVKKVKLEGMAGKKTFTANWKALPAPENVKATLRTIKNGYNDIKVTWNESKGAAGYKVYYKEADAEEYTFLRSVKGTKVIKNNLKAGVKYRFKIIPYFQSGEKTYLSTTCKIVSRTTLQKITDVQVVKSGKKVKVSWNNIDGESGYQISVTKKKKASQKEPLTVKSTTAKSKKLEVKDKKTYYYRVRAYKMVDGKMVLGPWSDPVAFKWK